MYVISKWRAWEQFLFFRHELYVEMACNDLFGAGEGSQISPPNPNKKFKLEKCEIAIIDTDVQQLLIDFEVMIQLVKVNIVRILRKMFF